MILKLFLKLTLVIKDPLKGFEYPLRDFVFVSNIFRMAGNKW